MAAGKYALLIEQGATLNLDLVYKDSSNVPINLTDYIGRMQIKSGYADSNPTTYISLGSVSPQPDGTGLIIDAISGSINIFISAASSSVLTFDTAYYDLELQAPTGIVTRLIEGTVKLSKQVTI